jgi:DNA recombination protein RmuC
VNAHFLLGLAIGLVLGLLIGLLLARARLARLRAELELRSAIGQEVRAAVEASQRPALEHAQQALLAQANHQLRQAQEAVGQATAGVVGPLREHLAKLEDQVRELERARAGAYEGLLTQVHELGQRVGELGQGTQALLRALRDPGARGRWGELQLRRVVEAAGMVDHVDFEEQRALAPGEDGDGRARPDLVVHLPGGAVVVVDAKVPLDAYLDAQQAEDRLTQRAHLQRHARQLRTHVEALASRGYSRQLAGSVGSVVAFVPGEHLLAAALEADPGLLDDALTRGVLLATPVTLVALLKAAATGWQHERLAESAREVQALGQELARRLQRFTTHLSGVGQSLDQAVRRYNEAVGSFTSRLLPQARRFEDLGVVSGPELPEEPPVLTTQPRELPGARSPEQ